MMKRRLHALLGSLAILLSPAASAAPIGQPPALPQPVDAADAAYREGLAGLVANNLTASEAAFRRSLSIDPKRADAMLGLAEVAFRRKQLDEAKTLILKAVDTDPRNANAHASLGRAHALDRAYDKAEQSLKQAIALDSTLVRPRMDLADLYATALRRPAEAVQLYQDVIAIAPEHAGAHYAQGVILSGMTDRVDQARSLLEKAALLEPRNPLPALALARLSAATGDMAAAQRWLAKALEIDPQQSEARELKGDFLHAQGDAARALEEYKAAAASLATNGMALAKIGSIHQSAGRTNEAIAAYRESIQRTPQNAIALNNLAFLLANRGNLKEAATLAHSAVRAAPNNAALLDTLGVIEHKQGKHREAVASLSQAAQAAPRSGLIQFHLGLAHVAAGQKDEGGKALRAALELEPDAEWAAEARSSLSRLNGN